MSKPSKPEISDSTKQYSSSLSKLEYNRKRYWANREKLLAQHRDYYKKNRKKLIEKTKEYYEKPEIKKKRKEYLQEYQSKNSQQLTDKAIKWNRENKERRKVIRDKYRLANVEKVKEINRKYRFKNKQIVIEHYSRGSNSCACCGEAIIQFLTIDHIEGGGNIHRQEIKIRGGHNFYAWLIKNDYPDGFQILCMNCNIAKHHYKVCPHQMPQNTIIPL